VRIFDLAATQRLLPFGELSEEIRAVLHDKQAGKVIAPQRLTMPLPEDGLLLAMPATDDRIAITKLVTVHAHNATLKLPSIHGEVIVMNASTGQRLMILDGKAVTARRTAAVSLLAARTLASEEAKRSALLILGAGTQGRAHLEAFAESFPSSHAFIYSRSFDDAHSLAQLGPSLGIRAQAVGAIDDILPVCGMIVTATTSETPVIGDRVREGAFIAAVGAYRPTMAELPPELVRRGRLFVDTMEGARHEAGDLIQADVDWSEVTSLEDAILDARHDRDMAGARRGASRRPIIFKSVGHALWDLAAARLAARHSGRLL
jgi:ornithine cyclodeaminase